MPYRLAIAHWPLNEVSPADADAPDSSKRWIVGLEPTVSRTTIWRVSQLRHTHHVRVPEGIRTPDPRLRRPLLYPAELRTHMYADYSLRASCRRANLILICCSCRDPVFDIQKRVMGIEPTYLAWKASVLPLNYTRKGSTDSIVYRRNIGVTGFEPATSWSQTRRSSQTEPHPGKTYFRDASNIIVNPMPNVKQKMQKFWEDIWGQVPCVI